MADKRKRSTEEKDVKAYKSDKRPRKGFTVGPANLPDGAYKRKNQKIKANLIEKAQIKKNYSKLKKQGHVPLEPESLPIPASLATESQINVDEPVDHADDDDTDANGANALHPDRQALVDSTSIDQSPNEKVTDRKPHERTRRAKPIPFQREFDQGQQHKREIEERRQAREQAERERREKTEDRERFRKSMAKARTGGVNGQRKLGRESKVLLEKVKKMMG